MNKIIDTIQRKRLNIAKRRQENMKFKLAKLKQETAIEKAKAELEAAKAEKRIHQNTARQNSLMEKKEKSYELPFMSNDMDEQLPPAFQKKKNQDSYFF